MNIKEIIEALEVGLENTKQMKAYSFEEFHTDCDIERIEASYNQDIAKILKN